MEPAAVSSGKSADVVIIDEVADDVFRTEKPATE